MKAHGVTLTTTNQLLAELAYDWAQGKGHTIQTILYQENLRQYIEG
jgi:hypothetical protein